MVLGHSASIASLRLPLISCRQRAAHHCPEPSLMLGEMELWLKRVLGGWADLGGKTEQ